MIYVNNTQVNSQETAEQALKIITQLTDSLAGYVGDPVSELVCQASNVLDEGVAFDHPDHGAGYWVPESRWEDLTRAYNDAV